MKPDIQQIKLIDKIIQELDYWKSTNDINSPSHRASIEDMVCELEEPLRFRLEALMCDLFCCVKNYKTFELIKRKEVTNPELKKAVSKAKKTLSKKS